MTKRRRLKVIIPLLLGLFIVGYSLWQLRHVISGPTITLESPDVSQPLADDRVVVAGKATDIDWLFLNDQQIFTDQAGHFTQTILGLPGYNIMRLEGKDKFGRRTVKMLEFVITNQQQL